MEIAVVGVRVVKVPVDEIVHMIAVMNGRVAASGAVHMSVIGMIGHDRILRTWEKAPTARRRGPARPRSGRRRAGRRANR